MLRPLQSVAALLIAGLTAFGAAPQRAGADASAAAVVSTLSDGSHLLVTFDRDGPFTIDIAALSARLTSPRSSRPFVLRPVSGQSIVASPATASATPSAFHLALRFSAAGVPGGMYDLHMDFTHAVLDRHGAAIAVEYRWRRLPIVSVPATPDAELSRVRRLYVGTIVYPATATDGMGLSCTVSRLRATYVVDNPEPRVVSIERSKNVGGALVPDDEYLGDPRGVLALPPLEFTVAVRADAEMHRVLSNNGPAPLERLAGRECARLSIVFATAWHAQRTLRSTPVTARVGPTQADRKALANGHPLLGMTHEQVAAIWGYPPDLLDVPALDSLSVWQWPNARDIRWVHFTGDRADSFTRRS